MGNGVDVDPDENVMRASRKLRQSGGSLVVSLPPEMLQSVGFEEGDELVLEAEWAGDTICLRKVDDVADENDES
jgi:antitoxin component of MazEF toxin-antitoxin module